jgi:lipoyl(octanoyl) transferase
MVSVELEDLETIDFKKAWDYQEELFQKSLKCKAENKRVHNYLLFCEHPHVYTLGKSGDKRNLLLNEDLLKHKKATFYKINRGGDITYHGPGQIVVYPIIDLEQFNINIKDYICKIEEAIISTLSEFNIIAERLEGATGIWLDTNNTKTRKICAIGVRASRYITMHGFAFNVNTNLEYFTYINPCGYIDKGVTSMKKELGKEQNVEEVKKILLKKIIEEFNMKI